MLAKLAVWVGWVKVMGLRVVLNAICASSCSGGPNSGGPGTYGGKEGCVAESQLEG